MQQTRIYYIYLLGAPLKKKHLLHDGIKSWKEMY
jgi:hypothetical protein